jgi:mRNA interferase RelE/StbE
MIIKIDRSFERDVKNLPGEIQQRLKKIIDQIHISNSIVDVGAEKLAGAKQAYKIRIGNYRIGLYK